MVVGELIYVALAGAAIVLVILTRKIVRLTIRFAHNHWRFLPAPPADELAKPADQEPAATDGNVPVEHGQTESATDGTKQTKKAPPD